ncbi:MAG TPA: (d)CMP kinase [Clostridiaceae bacterium]|mgnify:FL=1|nr:(d)CMP kinase [Clostridiaceae bacterium]HBX48970.1 (d)CMP kinase [Clostridiaceae bacterium]
MERIVVAIDGPAGAGKSTISKIIAQKLNLKYIDTGAMYRAVTLKAIKNNLDLCNNNEISHMVKNSNISINDEKIFIDEIDVTEEIRMPYVNEKVSIVSAMPGVREVLKEKQRKMAENFNVIMDGRDIGTNVLKDANIKIFLTASVEERAKRRYKEMIEKGINTTFEDVFKDIENRDKIDSSRKANPLKKADDAVMLDTTGMKMNEVVDAIIKIIQDRM